MNPSTIFTIGHSNHSSDKFIGLLKYHNIQVVADTRSSPSSKFVPHFNIDLLRDALTRSNIKYVFLGDLLGGRPEQPEFYDADGHVLYEKVAQTDFFNEGIARLLRGMQEWRIALLCAEEDPTDCHRRLLVGKVLFDQGVRIEHIRKDARIEIEKDPLSQINQKHAQETFFAEERSSTWKSILSVLPKKAPNVSSQY